MKTYGGMKVEGDKLTKDQIERRRLMLARQRSHTNMPKRHGKVRIKVQRTLEIPGVNPRGSKSFKKFQGVCLGKSKRRCPDCEKHLLRWKGPLGKQHLSCPRCGNKDGMPSSEMRRQQVRSALRGAGIHLRG